MSTCTKQNRKGGTSDLSLPDDRKESAVETKFNAAVKKAGGVSRKQAGGGGDLDRRVVWPNGVTTYAEIKRVKDGVVSKTQAEEVALLTNLGHLAVVIRNELDIARFIKQSLDRVKAAA